MATDFRENTCFALYPLMFPNHPSLTYACERIRPIQVRSSSSAAWRCLYVGAHACMHGSYAAACRTAQAP